MHDEPELAEFQAALLELLDAELPPEEVRRRILAHPAASSFRAWIERWEPRCIETASLLVRRWGHRRTAAASDPLPSASPGARELADHELAAVAAGAGPSRPAPLGSLG